jgi:hypothetical protein
LKKVNKLPIGPEWKCNIIEVTGNQLDDDGNTMTEQLELWHRDPVECVKALMGNPGFKDFICYVLERVYMDDEGKSRVFDKMWTGNWWWETQVCLFKRVTKNTYFFLVEVTKRRDHRANHSFFG